MTRTATDDGARLRPLPVDGAAPTTRDGQVVHAGPTPDRSVAAR